jgi:hypothetical protein
MKKRYATAIFLLVGCSLSMAVHIRPSPLPEKVAGSDVIAIATYTAPTKKGGMVAYTRVRDAWKEMAWEYNKLQVQASDDQVLDYLKELKLLSSKLSSVTNDYAFDALSIEYRRHQREFTAPFTVDVLLKGSVSTNAFFLTYTQRVTSEYKQPFEEGKQYILFLADCDRYPKPLHFFPAFSQWSMSGSVYPVSTNYVFYDEWQTTHIGKPFVPLSQEVWKKQHQGEREFTHKQLIQRIEYLIEKAEMITR